MQINEPKRDTSAADNLADKVSGLSGHETTEALAERMPVEVQAFVAVMEEDTDSARRLVYGMSGRDRAVLAYYLKELSGVVEEADGYRL